ncbi:mitochondrial 37S ribosomal protein mS46 RSM28 [Saccharomyces eubayanus]|uniref:mitochondrial 37S ribosomal protein mS46 RSM28 n=1 Tax=Saccharomyces eubayanus TaxID=1080349 RepID=UPI0006BEF9F9|nr:RSM28-like protein [Saccharomyces eubayanus]KOH01298.1 RSM28-like protein [Saccharomyces eubayanus]
MRSSMFRCVSRAHYSTNVTEEFINSILARAQEATAKASSNAIKMDQKKGHRASNMNRSRNQNRNNRNNNEGKDIEGRQGERNMRLNNRAPNGDSTQNTNRQKWNRSTTTSFIKDPSDTTVVVQPQFKKMQNHRNNFNENSKVEDDLLDVFNSSMDQKQRPNNFNKNTKPQARFQKKSHILTASKRRNAPKQQQVQRPVKRPASTEYVLYEPTPLSLLEYSPQVFPTKESKLVNYTLDSLKKSNYPVYRSPNLGILKKHDYTLNTPYFGKYTPGSSLIFAKEPQLQNLPLQEDFDGLVKHVRGEYQLLKPYERKDFEKLTKSKEVVDKLVQNSRIARLSLQSVAIASEEKKLIYDVCSGIKPISELQQ